MLYLAVQAVATCLWWLALTIAPAARRAFLPTGAPDSVLLAFAPPDLLLLAPASLATAYGLARRRAWGWPALCLTAGASIYPAFYAVGLPLATGEGWLGAVLMAPAILVLPPLVWLLRPRT